MEDNDDEEHFESIVYGQGEPNQDAESRLGQQLHIHAIINSTCLCKTTPNSRMATPTN
jgi:hypothetical protein